jgi:hypothetical protein
LPALGEATRPLLGSIGAEPGAVKLPVRGCIGGGGVLGGGG